MRLDPDETAKLIMQRIADAEERQASPGLYALLHANGMRFPDLVELISEDAVIVMGDEL